MRVPTREAAHGTPYEQMWQTPPHWPQDVHMVSMDQMGNLGIDLDNNLYWDGVPIVTRRTVQLEGWSLLLASVATAATVLAAVWPVGLHLQWW